MLGWFGGIRFVGVKYIWYECVTLRLPKTKIKVRLGTDRLCTRPWEGGALQKLRRTPRVLDWAMSGRLGYEC